MALEVCIFGRLLFRERTYNSSILEEIISRQSGRACHVDGEKRRNFHIFFDASLLRCSGLRRRFHGWILLERRPSGGHYRLAFPGGRQNPEDFLQ